MTPLFVMAQKEGVNWHFGYKAGIHFDGCAITPITNGQMEAFEGCASISDKEGNLLFYTNGGGRLPVSGQSPGFIWNADNDILYNMMGNQGGGFSSAQSSVFIPQPGNDSIFYLFTMEEAEYFVDGDTVDRGLSFFEINRFLNGGLGSVTKPSQTIYKPAFESLAAALHENEQDYWIITVDYPSFNFVVVPVTENGPGIPQKFNGGPLSYSGVIKVSPNRKWLTINGLLYEFDAVSGSIDNGILLSNDGISSYSFSPDSRFVFVIRNSTAGRSLWRYDVEAPNIQASALLITDLPGNNFYGPMQLAPDGNIYFLESNIQTLDNMFLSRIHCPNASQVFYEPKLEAFPTNPSFGIFFGLPNFADHLFADPREVPFTLDLGGDTLYVCPGGTLTLSTGIDANDNCQIDVLGWSTGSQATEIEVVDPGIYHVTVAAFCGKLVDSVVVKEGAPPLSINFFNTDSIICPGDTLIIEPTTTGANFFNWSTGDSSSSLLATMPGDYALSISNTCGDIVSDTLSVVAIDAPFIEVFLDSSSYCVDEKLILYATPGSTDSLIWPTPGLSDSMLVNPGEKLTLQASNFCTTTLIDIDIPFPVCTDCFAIPNLFSPNNDGLNDIFEPVIKCTNVSYTMQIFSRFGQLVYENGNTQVGWDGFVAASNKEAAPDAYIYHVVVQTGADAPQTYSGEFLLLR